jgi:hypothetical protein
MAPRKRLPWEKWKQKAEAEYVKNKYSVKEMIRDWGFPSDLSPDEWGFNFQNGVLRKKNTRVRKETRGSEARRAATNEQTLTRQDYVDYAKRNSYSIEQANQLFEENEARLKELKGQKSATQHYEHLLPTRSPMRGGVEHYRNIVMMGSEENLAKSDYLASMPAAREAGVPLTKQGALFADFNQLPVPTDQRRVDIILKDIGSQESPKTTRDVRAALQQSEMAETVGQKFKFSGGSARLKAGSVLPLVGLAATALSAGQAFAAGDVREGTARTLEGVVGEIPIAGDVVQPEATAGGTFEDVQRRTAEGLRAKELQQRAAEARQRGGKLSFGVGGVKFKLPEFGLSELMGIN